MKVSNSSEDVSFVTRTCNLSLEIEIPREDGDECFDVEITFTEDVGEDDSDVYRHTTLAEVRNSFEDVFLGTIPSEEQDKVLTLILDYLNEININVQ